MTSVTHFRTGKTADEESSSTYIHTTAVSGKYKCHCSLNWYIQYTS